MLASALRRLVVAGTVLAAALGAASQVGAAEQNAYVATPLVSNGAVPAMFTDTSLVNAWGLTASPTSPWWVSDNGADVSTLYLGTGAKVSLPGTAVGGPIVGGGPTGTVFNGTGAFALPTGGPSRFLFASEDGMLRAWGGGAAAAVTADLSGEDAIFKGLAIASTPDGPRLYATDFHNGRVDVFDGDWNVVSTFTDAALPDGYAPFGIQTIGDRIFVTFAKQDADAEDDLHGQSLGFVDAFDTAGGLLARVAQRGQLNAPWGLAWAPASFGRFAGDLLVGNFGDGEINAYAELPNGHFEHRGELRGVEGKPIAIDGLWALEFGNDQLAGPSDRLFFTAGPNDEADGLFGSIDPA